MCIYTHKKPAHSCLLCVISIIIILSILTMLYTNKNITLYYFCRVVFCNVFGKYYIGVRIFSEKYAML